MTAVPFKLDHLALISQYFLPVGHRKKHSDATRNSFSRTTPNQIRSPYQRVFSKIQRDSRQLPAFLQPQHDTRGLLDRLHLETVAERHIHLGCLDETWISSDSEKHSSPRQASSSNFMSYHTLQRLKLSKMKIKQIVEAQKLRESILNIENCDEEVVVRIRHWQVTRGQMKQFVSKADLSSQMMDLCMFLLKRIELNTKVVHKILIASVNFSEKILKSKDEPIVSYTDLSHYDVIMFPIWSGYWSLLVAYLEQQKIELYDPLNTAAEHGEYLQAMDRFTKFNYYFRRNPNYFQFEYKPVSYRVFRRSDSGVFVCKHAERILSDYTVDLDPTLADEYKNEILRSLLNTHLIKNKQ